MILRLDLYCTNSAQHLVTAGYGLDDLDGDLTNASYPFKGGGFLLAMAIVNRGVNGVTAIGVHPTRF